MISVFFFKQKTAYVLRISDWSSDVFSSDLRHPRFDRNGRGGHGGAALGRQLLADAGAAAPVQRHRQLPSYGGALLHPGRRADENGRASGREHGWEDV